MKHLLVFLITAMTGGIGMSFCIAGWATQNRTMCIVGLAWITVAFIVSLTSNLTDAK